MSNLDDATIISFDHKLVDGNGPQDKRITSTVESLEAGEGEEGMGKHSSRLNVRNSHRDSLKRGDSLTTSQRWGLTKQSRHSWMSSETFRQVAAEEDQVKNHRKLFSYAVLLAYFVVACIAYPLLEGWSVAQSIYFAMVTVSTVGYGVFCPKHDSSRLFTLFYILFGISIVWVGLQEIAHQIVEAKIEKQRREKEKHLLKSNVLSKINQSCGIIPHPDSPHTHSPKEDKLKYAFTWPSSMPTKFETLSRIGDSFVSKRTEWSDTIRRKVKGVPLVETIWHVLSSPIVVAFAKIIGYTVATAAILSVFEKGEDHETFISWMYFIVVTGTTVGYGDVTPTSDEARALNFFFIPLTVMWMSTQLNQIASHVLHDIRNDKMSVMMKADMTLEALFNMDEDGDGAITEFEFIKFMLTKSEMIDVAVLDNLHDDSRRPPRKRTLSGVTRL